MAVRHLKRYASWVQTVKRLSFIKIVLRNARNKFLVKFFLLLGPSACAESFLKTIFINATQKVRFPLVYVLRNDYAGRRGRGLGNFSRNFRSFRGHIQEGT